MRQEAGLRQWELARHLGTSQSAIHKYEHGVIPEPRRLLEIARIGRTSIEWLLTGRHGDGGGVQRERPPDDAQRTAEAVLRLAGPDRGRVEEAIRVLRTAARALDGAKEAADLLETARSVHRSLLAQILAEASSRMGGEDVSTDPGDWGGR